MTHKHSKKQHEAEFFKVMAESDYATHKLENNLMLASILSGKGKQRIHIVVEVNESRLEKRELLYKISEAEEMGNKGIMKFNRSL